MASIIKQIRYAATLAKNSKLIVDLNTQTKYLTKKDIRAWRNAWQAAIDKERPDRSALYAVYTDTLIDNHLSGAIGQRKDMTAQKAFRITGKDGKENSDLTKVFESGWFKDFIDYALDATYWGHSLIELGDVIQTDSGKHFSGCTLIPREHVIPEYGLLLVNQDDEYRRGYDYRSGDLARWCIEVGKPDDLGLLLKVAPQAISKRHALGFWDQFGEIFGAPIRIAKTASRDEKERSRIFRMISQMGFSNSAVLPQGTEIELKETNRTDSFNVFDKRVDRANSEMSKAILGQTMTLENGSSKSQGEVHLEVLKNIVAKDADRLKDTVNDKLIPLCEMHGILPAGCRFEWVENIDYTPEQQMDIEKMLLEHYDVDKSYFEKKYNVKLKERKKESAGFFD